MPMEKWAILDSNSLCVGGSPRTGGTPLTTHIKQVIAFERKRRDASTAIPEICKLFIRVFEYKLGHSSSYNDRRSVKRLNRVRCCSIKARKGSPKSGANESHHS